ncbi:MAG: hypothetical protein M1821_000515 [Bathelium mastoideum]|nr:MAG: hypothetical protein M1821_000515 [Bathelium mastoideum]
MHGDGERSVFAVEMLEGIDDVERQDLGIFRPRAYVPGDVCVRGILTDDTRQEGTARRTEQTRSERATRGRLRVRLARKLVEKVAGKVECSATAAAILIPADKQLNRSRIMVSSQLVALHDAALGRGFANL